MRRLKIVAVTPELLIKMGHVGTRTYVVTKNALPADAKIVGASMGDDNRYLLLKVESADYPEVEPGGWIPFADPVEWDAVEDREFIAAYDRAREADLS